MLTFTPAGVVETPTILQIRVTRAFPGRVPAGAPEPPRALSDEEVRDNLEHFTVRQGPRSSPCKALVLSGVDLARRPGLGAVVAQGRAWGIEHVTLHLGRADREQLSDSPLGPQVDAVAVRVADVADVADVALLAATSTHVTAVVVLDEDGLAGLDDLAAALVGARPDRVVLTWPFPPAEPPPRARAVGAALPSALARLDAAGVPAGVKGLPLCALGDLPPERLWRSANRFYVDAAHQRDGALMFFPDVVRFAKSDVCRFCTASDRCDGAPEAWLVAGLAGPLSPLGGTR